MFLSCCSKTTVCIEGIKKVCYKLKVTEKEKSSIPSKNTIDFDKDNVRRKKKLLKKLKHVDHKDINLS